MNKIMLTLISCAKTMAAKTNIEVPATYEPAYAQTALEHALQLGQYSVEEMEDLLRVNRKIAAQNVLRYQNFPSEDNPALPALLAYTGMVFKRIAPGDFTAEDFRFAQDHLRITSFLYGLLRPLDVIRNYRLEGSVRPGFLGGNSFFDYWKERLTAPFISDIRNWGGVLLNLASGEMKQLFDWKEVCHATEVVDVDFYVRQGGRLKNVTVYAKMCRGEMTRYVLKNRIDHPDGIKNFSWEGFRLDETVSTPRHLVFVSQDI